MSSRNIFVNLPVKNLDRAVEFFTSLGFKFDENFTDENATCMIINENAFVMLLVEDFFKTFTSKSIADSGTIEAICALSAESREDVDRLVNGAIAAGGATPRDPMDQGPMYGWAFEDLDGHLWEVMYMDMNAMEA